MSRDATYSFLVEWYDPQAAMVRTYQMAYFVADDTIELYDLKNRRTFLKRCSYPSVQLSDLHLGATTTVYARQLKVVDYGDEFTRNALGNAQQKTLVLVKPDAYSQLGMIVDTINAGQFTISRMKMLALSEAQAQEFYGDREFTRRAQELSSGVVVALEVLGSGVAERLSPVLGGSRNSARAEEKTDGLELPGVYTSTSERTAEMEASFLFDNPRVGTTATLSNCTVCLVKPHAVLAGHTGQILDIILRSGFTITALESFSLDQQAAGEFLEVYRTVVPEYHAAVEHMTAGPILALELTKPDLAAGQDDGGVVQAFRELAGPSDPEIARHIRPNTLRAQFGQNKVKNAVHATDLPEDGPLEAEFFFSILQKR